MVFELSDVEGTGLRLVQQVAVKATMVRCMGTSQAAVVVFASAACDLRVYRFMEGARPLGELMQEVRLAKAGSSADARVEVDNTEWLGASLFRAFFVLFSRFLVRSRI